MLVFLEGSRAIRYTACAIVFVLLWSVRGLPLVASALSQKRPYATFSAAAIPTPTLLVLLSPLEPLI